VALVGRPGGAVVRALEAIGEVDPGRQIADAQLEDLVAVAVGATTPAARVRG
jgi:hypothetical protein